jgi:rhamnosyltransferase
MIDVSIIVLTKNAGERFEMLMRRIFSQKYSGEFEVLVIDSGSSDGTLDIAKKYGSRIFKIKPQEFHHSRTRNLGAKLAQGKYLVYITQDALPLDEYLLINLISPLDGDSQVAGVYGRQIAYPDAKPMEKFFYEYFYPNERRVITSKDLNDLSEFCTTHVYISDVCSALRKEAWAHVTFDESIIMAEDKKWAIDVLRAGYKIVYEPKATVYHSHNYSITSIFKRRFDDGVAMRQIFGKSGGVTSRGLIYLLSEIKYLTNNYKSWIPYALIYDLAMFTGLTLGKYYQYVPYKLRTKMSRHKDWWLQK